MHRLLPVFLLLGCDGEPDETPPTTDPSTPGTTDPEPVKDADEDGYTTREGDCDDDDPAVHPGAEDEPYDDLDADCDGASDNDADHDGYDAVGHAGLDCDDQDPEIHPNADELCNEIDDDCDGDIDDADSALDEGEYGYLDADGDGYGDALTGDRFCDLPADRVADGTDCDDLVATVHPSASDVLCDGLDNDCDATTWEAGEVRVGAMVAASLAAALDNAPAGATIELCEGRYTESGLSLANHDLVGLGGSGAVTVDAGGADRVLTIWGAATVTGVTLTGGDAGAADGGGIYVLTPEHVALEDVVLTGNVAEQGGGLFVYDGGDVQATALVVRANEAVGGLARGGGIALDSGVRMTLTDSTVEGNTANSSGGVHVGTDAVLEGFGATVVRDNEALIYGGGGVGTSSGATLTGLEVTSNVAESAAGIDVSGDATLADLVVSYNEATLLFGGGVRVGLGTSTLDRVEIVHNVGTFDGGGLYVVGSATLTDCTVQSNDTPGFLSVAGAAYLVGGTLTSVNTDWGTGVTDNTPGDMTLSQAGIDYNVAGVGSFTCRDNFQPDAGCD